MLTVTLLKDIGLVNIVYQDITISNSPVIARPFGKGGKRVAGNGGETIVPLRNRAAFHIVDVMGIVGSRIKERHVGTIGGTERGADKRGIAAVEPSCGQFLALENLVELNRAVGIIGDFGT